MGKHAQLVMGPAGAGKSTYCQAIRKHCEETRRTVHIVNLDPAADEFEEPPSIDIRDLITVDDVMDQLDYGPNGGLVYAMEYLVEHMDWLTDELGDYDDDYLILDCPGQIELYSHMTVMKRFVTQLEQEGYRVCALYLLDCQFMVDNGKFLSGALSCLSSMMRLELPHVNVLTKMDLLPKESKTRKLLDDYLDVDILSLLPKINEDTGPRFKALNKAIAGLLEDFGMVSFFPLDITDPESIFSLLQVIDNSIQYGEDLEVKEPFERDEDELDKDDVES